MSTPSTPTHSMPPQIMSKEVGRSSIWIRHRYPSFNHIAPPNMNINGNQKKYEPKPPQSKEMSFTAPESKKFNDDGLEFQPCDYKEKKVEIKELDEDLMAAFQESSFL